ncbi:MAG TPA: DNA internalization-related competence protein ComEC/Rec2 [Thermoanaerobaculia bacterium]|nr:DNA internalization-related competence protein ComEC/Rec2 [Thermoanaerobaculia bacterium]
MRNDVPAAFPLLALIAGLALAPVLTNPLAAVLGITLIACLRRSPSLFFVPLGLCLALHVQQRTAREQAAFIRIDPGRFTTIEVPLERDWAERDASFMLRASNFSANGAAFDTPIAVYARFEPPEISMEATLRAEGFLRLNERGEYSLGVKSPALLSYAGALPRWHPRTWNRILANRLEAHARDYPDEVALAQALLLGRGERLTEEMRESFRRGGTYHLLVFSGLQIALAAALLAMLLRRLHAPRASDWLLLAFSTLAPLFIGPTASVSRASVAIGLYALSRVLKRPTSLENLWCVAALLRLILEPRDLVDPSFHLTYAGAGALLFIGKRKWVWQALAAEITIAPLTLFHFHQYALGGTLLTFAMAPLIFAMLAASLVACAFPLALEAIRLLHALCTALNAFGFSGYFASPPVAAMIAAGLAALLVLALLRGRKRAVALSLVLLVPTAAAVMRSVSQQSAARPTVTFFDVGQGDAIAIRSGGETMLVDGGRDLRLLPLLADRGIRRIGTVLLTHAHPDHCASLPSVIENFGVDRVLVTSRRFRGECATRILAACSRSATPIRAIRDGEQLRVGAFTFDVHLADRTFRRAPENNASVILHATVEGRRFLFTGDSEKEAELTLADRDLRSDVLKVAHHGSRGSTSRTLLDQVAPRIAVISCGRHNLFGHPHPAVLDALRERGVRTWRTDLDGSVDVEVREGRLYVNGGRD